MHQPHEESCTKCISAKASDPTFLQVNCLLQWFSHPRKAGRWRSSYYRMQGIGQAVLRSVPLQLPG